MRAAVLTDALRIDVVERALPAPAGDQVRIRVGACGVCTSEIPLWTGNAPDELPAEIGHEIAGVVEEVGEHVTSMRSGDRVVVWTPGGGGFAEQMVADERCCIPVAPGLAYPAVAEPLACVVNAVELAAPALGDDVVIIGAGFMGLLVAVVSALKGPRSIVVADIRPDALARAAQLGATRVVDTSSESLSDVVGELTDGRAADVTYECTGVSAGLDLAGQVTRMSGKLAILGYHQGDARPVDLGHWNWMGFSILNAHFRDPAQILAGMRAGMRLVEAGVLDASPLVTHTYPLDEINEAFATATAKPAGFVKAVVEPARC